MTHGDCIFCDILAGRAPGTFVHRDQTVSAFMDIRPINPGHLLVVPNAHAAHLADLDEIDGMAMFRAAQRLAAAVRKSGLECEGVNLVLADGAAAGQDVFHVHLHVIPRFRGDDFGFRFSPDYGIRPRAELEAAGDRIREKLRQT